MTLRMFSAALALAITAGPALAQDFVDAKIQELFSQGYTHFQVVRGVLQTEIDAYGPNFTKLELQLSNADGAVLSQRTEIETQETYEANVGSISQSSIGVENETDDNLNETHDLNEANEIDGDDDAAGASGNSVNGHDSDDGADGHDVDGHENDSHDNDGHDGDDD